MSFPSAERLMTLLIEDQSLPSSVRLAALKDRNWRPSLAALLRLIRDPSTPVRLRAQAVIRYSFERNFKQEAKKERSQKTQHLARGEEDQTDLTRYSSLRPAI